MMSRFENVRKYSERIHRTTHRLSKPDSVPICRFRLILNSAPLLLAERAAKDLLLSCLTSVKFRTDSPLMHHENTIAHAQNFGHLRRNHDNRNAICSEPVHEVIDLFLCSHIDPTRRLVKNEDVRLTAQPFAQHDLLLISSAEIYHLLAERRRFDMEVAYEFSGKPLLLGAAHNPKLRNLIDAGKTHIRHHGQSQNQALRLSILRQETDSRRDGGARRPDFAKPAFDEDFSGIRFLESEDRSCEGCSARAHQPGNPEHFAAIHRKADVL